MKRCINCKTGRCRTQAKLCTRCEGKASSLRDYCLCPTHDGNRLMAIKKLVGGRRICRHCRAAQWIKNATGPTHDFVATDPRSTQDYADMRRAQLALIDGRIP